MAPSLARLDIDDDLARTKNRLQEAVSGTATDLICVFRTHCVPNEFEQSCLACAAWPNHNIETGAKRHIQTAEIAASYSNTRNPS